MIRALRAGVAPALAGPGLAVGIAGLACWALLAAWHPAPSDLSSLCLADPGLPSALGQGALAAGRGLGESLLYASVMTLAMMFPQLAARVRHLWARSLPARRPRACLLFLAATIAFWGLALPLFTGAGAVARGWAGGDPLRLCAFGAGLFLAWWGLPTRQRSLNRAHAFPSLPAFGWRADLAAARFGLAAAGACLVSAWPAMAFPFLFDRHHLPAMAAAAAYFLLEPAMAGRQPRWRPACALAGAALSLLALGLAR